MHVFYNIIILMLIAQHKTEVYAILQVQFYSKLQIKQTNIHREWNICFFFLLIKVNNCSGIQTAIIFWKTAQLFVEPVAKFSFFLYKIQDLIMLLKVALQTLFKKTKTKILWSPISCSNISIYINIILLLHWFYKSYLYSGRVVRSCLMCFIYYSVITIFEQI